ncbi:hypothetical protein V494_02115 [Pseudogymnoascus sp. VKM F-4513 (FW-928)]|nr:hypothetical protein V494_02115 [Pseudogymnoascus sp. VKM F-4513 (FW-928)]
MSMSKYNLYNLSKIKWAHTRGTYFQQKWKSKAATRAYHGEQIREKKWQRMFTSRIKSVVPMNHRYMAFHDGSEQAAGRGSGLQVEVNPDDKKIRPSKPIPFMGMTFAPVERRLDTAVFRALFASSARQARQFVLHGGVKVNGKKMTYPGYLLNPGDMFQVDPDRVLFATGAPKETEDVKATKSHRKRVAASKAPASTEETTSEEASGETTPAEEPELDEAAAEKKQRKEYKDNLQSLLDSARQVLNDKSADRPNAKKKQDIRAFAATVRRAIGNVNRTATEDLESQVAELVSKLSLANVPKAAPAPAPASGTTDPSVQAQVVASTRATISRVDRQMLADALREVRENPIDPTKPYATPWRPRPYMSAFAFVPRYLEVNHNICAAVYLRHPVARPGLAEVPSPFAPETLQLAYNWYLRRR